MKHVKHYKMQTIFFSVADKFVKTAKQLNNIAELVEYFESHRLNLKDKKTKFIVFCKTSQIKLTNILKLKVRKDFASLSPFLKEVTSTKMKLTERKKHVLKKMACSS